MEKLVSHILSAIVAGSFMLFSAILFVGLLVTDAIFRSQGAEFSDSSSAFYGMVFLVSAMFYVLGLSAFVKIWKQRKEIEEIASKS